MLNIPHVTIFSIPMKYVDVMRQTRTSIDFAAEHTLHDYWNDEGKVWVSQDWYGTNRFHILRIKLPVGYTRLNGRSTKATRPDTIWPEEWSRLFKKTKTGTKKEATRNRLIVDVSPEDTECHSRQNNYRNAQCRFFSN